MWKPVFPIAIGLAAAVGVAAPATSQMLWDEPQRQSDPAGTEVNEGRFVALGGIFGDLRIDCVRCHGLDGSGNSSGAFPRLTDQSAWYLYKTLQDFATGRRQSEIMEPIARSLTDEAMRNVAAYYASVEQAPYPEAPEADAEMLQIGGAISAAGLPEQGVPPCTNCHGVDGIGNTPVVPFLAGQFASYIEHQLLAWQRGERGGDPLNVMEMIARNMTEDQIRAVSLYFASVRPPEVTPEDLAILPLDKGVDGSAAASSEIPPTGAVEDTQAIEKTEAVPAAEPMPATPAAGPPAEEPMVPAAPAPEAGGAAPAAEEGRSPPYLVEVPLQDPGAVPQAPPPSPPPDPAEEQ